MDTNLSDLLRKIEILHRTMLTKDETLKSSVQDDCIKKIEQYLKSGGHIDDTDDTSDENTTILHNAVHSECENILKFALEKGANIGKAAKVREQRDIHGTYLVSSLRYYNALEAAIFYKANNRSCKILCEKSLEMYQIFGLTQLHIECAKGNLLEVEKYLEFDLLNKVIDVECPIWGGMSPILIAAKMNRQDVVNRLVDLGVSTLDRDAEGNTLLHFLVFHGIYDDRFINYSQDDTYSRVNGMSHFHIACMFCADNIETVKALLELGISPDLRVKTGQIEVSLIPIRSYSISKTHDSSYVLEGDTGLHIAAKKQNPELAKLLLLYGANANLPNCLNQTVSMTLTYLCHYNSDCIQEISCLLMETSTVYFNLLASWHIKKPLLSCMKKLIMLDNGIFPNNLLNLYKDGVINNRRWSYSKEDRFDESSYAKKCLEELNKLDEMDLRRVLNDNAVMKRNWKKKFEDYFYSSEISELFPIYGFMLKVSLKRIISRYEKKRSLVHEATPNITFLVRKFCNLPAMCAEEILSYLSIRELNDFMNMFENN